VSEGQRVSEPEESMRGLEESEGSTEIVDPVEFLAQLSEVQHQLREDFERLAAAVTPLLTKQYRDTEVRMRALETRLRNRQERPLIIQLANLLSDVRRIESAEDVKIHVEETILDVLTGVGYQEMGAEGDQFDPGFHEPLSGSAGRESVVTRVHRRGLACYGDVIIKAKVDVEPVLVRATEQGELQA
jgi:molecular chaperone GrpE (heat shock protein)